MFQKYLDTHRRGLSLKTETIEKRKSLKTVSCKCLKGRLVLGHLAIERL